MLLSLILQRSYRLGSLVLSRGHQTPKEEMSFSEFTRLMQERLYELDVSRQRSIDSALPELALPEYSRLFRLLITLSRGASGRGETTAIADVVASVLKKKGRPQGIAFDEAH